jgi:uncharacterized protein YcaQ
LVEQPVCGALLDYLWTIGEVTIVGREKMDRIWGLTADFLPAWTPREGLTAAEVTRTAVQKSLQTLGIATKRDIRENFTRGIYPGLDKVLKALLTEETLHPVQVGQ